MNRRSLAAGLGALLLGAALAGPIGAARDAGPEPAIRIPPRHPERPFDAKLRKLDGSRLRLSELRGKPVLLKLWATWCLPCREQARVLDALAGELAARGVSVYAVDVGESPEVVKPFLDKEPSGFPVLLDRDQSIPLGLGVGALPALVLLRGDGTIAAISQGVTRHDEVLEVLGELGAGAPEPPD